MPTSWFAHHGPLEHSEEHSHGADLKNRCTYAHHTFTELFEHLTTDITSPSSIHFQLSLHFQLQILRLAFLVTSLPGKPSTSLFLCSRTRHYQPRNSPALSSPRPALPQAYLFGKPYLIFSALSNFSELLIPLVFHFLILRLSKAHPQQNSDHICQFLLPGILFLWVCLLSAPLF